jgi:hypothetical protein
MEDFFPQVVFTIFGGGRDRPALAGGVGDAGRLSD